MENQGFSVTNQQAVRTNLSYNAVKGSEQHSDMAPLPFDAIDDQKAPSLKTDVMVDPTNTTEFWGTNTTGELSQNPNVSLLHLEKDEIRKEDQTKAVEKAMETGGEVAAAEKKWQYIVEDLAETLGYVDESGKIDQEKMDAYLASEAGEALKKLHFNKLKGDLKIQKGYESDDEIPLEDLNRIEAQASELARNQKDRSWQELSFDVADGIINSVDAQTFIMALIGKDVGDGRYGESSLSHDTSSEVGNPGSLVSFALEKYKNQPEHIHSMLNAGFESIHERAAVGASQEQVVSLLKDKISKDPRLAKSFVWGVYNRLGQPALGGRLSSEQSISVIETIVLQLEKGVIHLESEEVSPSKAPLPSAA